MGQLRDLDPEGLPRSLLAIRLLCRGFYQIGTPIAYHAVHLTDRVIRDDAESLFPNALKHIFVHARHVVVRSNLNRQGVKTLLDNIQKLQSVRYIFAPFYVRPMPGLTRLLVPSWCYTDEGFRSGDLWCPSDILSLKSNNAKRPRIYVEDLPLRSLEGSQPDIYLRAIPSELLVSLKLTMPTPPLTTRLNSLKRLLLEAQSLETFHYQDLGQGTQFTFSGSERLPPFTELYMQSYNWNHSRSDVATHWDFSRIRSLEILSMPIYNFLSSVPFGDFSKLHTLHVEDYSAHCGPDRRKEATLELYTLVRDHILALKSLKIVCHVASFHLDGLLTHANTLQTLLFRDHVGFTEGDKHCPTLRHDELARLSQAMTMLTTLEIDMDIMSTRAEKVCFLEAICEFPDLHTLTLHVQTRLMADHIYEAGDDPDKAEAKWAFQSLLRYRDISEDGHCHYEQGKQHWRRITINVGGWRRVMIRRLGEAWRAQNRRGVFAERCFVLERAPRGEYVAREQEVGRDEGSVGMPVVDLAEW